MAMDEILDEHEQSERVREWLRRNGGAIFLGVALGLAAIGGWQWWQRHQEQSRLQAATDYQAALDAIRAKDKADARVKAVPEGMFRTLAQLELARSQIEAGQRDAALATLRAIEADEPALAAIVDQRLARVLIDAGQADAALKLVVDDESIPALEVRGDAQMALGQRDQARDAYNKALLRTEIGTPQRRLLELKLAEAGGTPPQSENKS